MSTTERHIIRGLRELGTLDVTRDTLPVMLQRVALIANDVIPGSSYAGISLDVNGHVSTAAFTDDVVPEIDQAQNRTGIGPCVSAAREARVVVVRSTRNDEHWKWFAQACRTHGVLSTLSVPVISNSGKRAALNFYSRQEGAFGDDDLEVADAFAAQAGAAIRNSEAYWSVRQLADHLSIALETRVIIEQAKGVLIAGGRTGDEAFDLLRSASQRTNTKLRDVAAQLVAQAEQRSQSHELE